MTACVLLCAIVVLPLGLVYAHNDRTGIEEYFSRLGITEETQNRIRDHLEENGVSNNQMEQTLGGMLRIVHEVQAEGEDFELDPKLRNYFENEVGLANEQIELVQSYVQRIVLGGRRMAPRTEADDKTHEGTGGESRPPAFKR